MSVPICHSQSLQTRQAIEKADHHAGIGERVFVESSGQSKRGGGQHSDDVGRCMGNHIRRPQCKLEASAPLGGAKGQSKMLPNGVGKNWSAFGWMAP